MSSRVGPRSPSWLRVRGPGRVAALALLAVAAAGCGAAAPTAKPTPTQDFTVTLRTAQGSAVATVTLSPVFDSPAVVIPSPPIGLSTHHAEIAVEFDVVARGLSPGSHGFEVHSVGSCSGVYFSNSGEILNPYLRAHGFSALNGPEAGDLPNIAVGTDGRSTTTFVTDLLTLSPGQPNSLTGPQGTSLVLETNSDNELSQPNGGAGVAIACGVISPHQTGSTAPALPTPTATPTASASATARPSGSAGPSVRPTGTSSAGASSSASATATHSG